MEVLTLLVIGVLILLFKYAHKKLKAIYGVFEKQNIPFVKPIPLLGTNWPILFQTKNFEEMLLDAVKQFPKAKIIGMFQQTTPVYLITDPELVKQIAVKDFEYFTDHFPILNETTDPIFGNMLSVMNGQKWKDMRTTLSPMFTGSKMRHMFDLITEVGEHMSDHFRAAAGPDRVVEMKDVLSRFALEIIASTNFGLEVNSFKDKDHPFFKRIRNMIDFRKLSFTLRLSFGILAPGLANFFKVRLISEENASFFIDMVKETEKLREKENIRRPDMINLIMELKKGTLKHEKEDDEDIGFATVQESDLTKVAPKHQFREIELMAQAFIFLFAGFEGTSTAMVFLFYELATNPHVQEKLINEIDDVIESLNGKRFNYEKLQRMKYLDMIVSETLRRWTIADANDRMCLKDYAMKNDLGEDFTIKKGSIVWIPAAAFHMSEKYFENPKKFDPERFSDENKDKINRDAYLPFGIGPRNCIGSRFALMEIKAAAFYLLRDFRVEVTEKTQIPLQTKKGFIKQPQKGVYLRLAPRK